MKEAEKANLICARDAYLLSLLDLESTFLNSNKINSALSTQGLYLKKLFEKVNQEFQTSKQKIRESGSEANKRLKSQISNIQFGSTYLESCISILEVPLLQNQFELDLRPGIVGKEIPNEELIHGYDPFFNALCHIPLAETARHKIVDILHLLEKNNPLVDYHEAKMYEINASLIFAEVLMVKNSERLKGAVIQLSKAFNSISQAVSLVGYSANRSIEIATLLRYAHLCYFAARTFRLHQIPIPDEHMERMKKAVNLLGKISDDKNAKILQQKLIRFKEH